MTITREQVADLQPGDVVELRNERWPEGTVIRGPLHLNEGRLECGPAVARWSNGDQQSAYDLTVVSRAPRPLYVNHPRTEPRPGDIVRDNDGDAWRYWDIGWCIADKVSRNPAEVDIRCYGPLRLLWDGQSGQVVQ